MTKRYLVNAVAGTLAERPDPSTPSGGASESPFGLYLDTGTGDIYESTGSAWVKIGTLTGSGGGSITDATTTAIGGVEVDHARSGSHSVALTTDGLALPAGMIGTASTKAAAGNDSRLSDARTPTAHAATHVGAGGDVVYPGVTADGLTPGGIAVAGAAGITGAVSGASVTATGAVVAGDQTAASVPDFHSLYGSVFIGDAPGNNVDGDPVVVITQRQHITSDSFSFQAFRVNRQGAIDDGQDYGEPMVQLQDDTTSAQPLQQWVKQTVEQARVDGNGITVAKKVAAANALLSGAGGTTPTLAVTKLAGQTGLLIACTDESDVPKVSIAVDGEIVTADDVLAPTGVIKGATVALYTSGTGAPSSGTHSQGEFHGDTAGALFYCTGDGTPGTWKQVTLT